MADMNQFPNLFRLDFIAKTSDLLSEIFSAAFCCVFASILLRCASRSAFHPVAQEIARCKDPDRVLNALTAMLMADPGLMKGGAQDGQ